MEKKTNLPKRAYLNKLVDVGRLLPDPQRGVWLGDPGAANFLSNLVHDIDVGGTIADPRLAHSVPSVFARPILFAQALVDDASPLHDAVVNEWRGLMAVLALESWMAYKVEFVDYPVLPPSAGASSFVGRVPGDDLHLRTMLNSLLPQPPTFWNPLKLIYVNKILVGAASPWTVVFTPASKVPTPVVPWSEDGVLVDPILLYRKAAGPSLELTILYHWITHFINAGNDPTTPNWGMNAVGGTYLAAVARQLASPGRDGLRPSPLFGWQQDLLPYVDPNWNVPGLQPANAKAGAYQHALRGAQLPMPVVAPGAAAVAAPPQSDLFLQSSRSGVADVVVLKRKGLPACSRVHNAAFVGDIDIEHLPASFGKSLETKGGVVHGVNWLMADEVFFSPKIARVGLGDAALTCGPGAAADYSLPVTTALLKYFTHEDLSRMLQVAVTGAGSNSILTATLTLP
ncbi:MAG: hypothetical protein M1608_06580, partial [Candidatus Omnitrophica bacterium]|nr:hypothetical protein [Candidatus Omnitrophota bacterium]